MWGPPQRSRMPSITPPAFACVSCRFDWKNCWQSRSSGFCKNLGAHFKVGDKLPVLQTFVGIIFYPQNVGRMDGGQHAATIRKRDDAAADLVYSEGPPGKAPYRRSEERRVGKECRS